jgi:hypothetical protein
MIVSPDIGPGPGILLSDDNWYEICLCYGLNTNRVDLTAFRSHVARIITSGEGGILATGNEHPPSNPIRP